MELEKFIEEAKKGRPLHELLLQHVQDVCQSDDQLLGDQKIENFVQYQKDMNTLLTAFAVFSELEDFEKWVCRRFAIFSPFQLFVGKDRSTIHRIMEIFRHIQSQADWKSEIVIEDIFFTTQTAKPAMFSHVKDFFKEIFN